MERTNEFQTNRKKQAKRIKKQNQDIKRLERERETELLFNLVIVGKEFKGKNGRCIIKNVE